MKGLVALCCAAYAAALSARASKPMPPARAEPPPTKETYEFSYSRFKWSIIESHGSKCAAYCTASGSKQGAIGRTPSKTCEV